MIRVPAATLAALRLAAQVNGVPVVIAFQFGDRVEAYGVDAIIFRKFDSTVTLITDEFDDGSNDWVYASNVERATDAAAEISTTTSAAVMILNGDDLERELERLKQ